MINRSVTRSALSGTVALAATGLLVLLPSSPPAAADSRSDPAVRAPGLPRVPVVAGFPGVHGSAGSPGASGSPRSSGSPGSHGSPRSVSAAHGPAAGAHGPASAPGADIDRALLYRPGTHARPKPGAPAPPELSAVSWLVADAGTGEVLAARDAHLKLPPASTLKTLFAITALPRLAEHSKHKVSEEELDDIGPGSSTVGIVGGESYEVADLWRGVFLSSGNDAVRALSEMNGGWDSTVAQMRKKAKLLGALDTHVVSPDGYDAPGQVSSAYDLSVFARAGLSSPEFVRYSSTVDAEFPGYGGTFGIVNTNRLLSGEDGVEPYPGLIGVKNGYTSEAGYTLIAAAKRGGRTVLVTVMNPQWGGVHAVYEEARELLDWGFTAGKRVVPVGTLKPPPPPVPPMPPTPPKPAGPGSSPMAKVAGAAPGARSVTVARAQDDGSGSGYLVPAAFVGSACLAAVGLFVVRHVRRSGRRRPKEEEIIH
ncbi:D-alanyl-D-alanine carboxypeptidase family protein [Streptomyces sp. NPDC102274]|uniref:D-alanyl-D-alanine carboxypeptidase family protein n=1 Tax=Streptomyces sp. NPDC102274 TaxID=3366151 RepID=UPI0038230FC5